jgi:hypothetical protein
MTLDQAEVGTSLCPIPAHSTVQALYVCQWPRTLRKRTLGWAQSEDVTPFKLVLVTENAVVTVDIGGAAVETVREGVDRADWTPFWRVETRDLMWITGHSRLYCGDWKDYMGKCTKFRPGEGQARKVMSGAIRPLLMSVCTPEDLENELPPPFERKRHLSSK